MKGISSVLVLIAIAVLGAVGVWYFNQASISDGDLMMSNNSTPTSVTMSDTGNRVEMEQDGRIDEGTTTMDEEGDNRYQAYGPQVLMDTADSRRVLYFYANWCPTCLPADVNFKANADMIPEDVRVIRVNYNDTETDADEKKLAADYDVIYQHTFVQIDGQGSVVTRWNGGQIEELLENIK